MSLTWWAVQFMHASSLVGEIVKAQGSDTSMGDALSKMQHKYQALQELLLNLLSPTSWDVLDLISLSTNLCHPFHACSVIIVRMLWFLDHSNNWDGKSELKRYVRTDKPKWHSDISSRKCYAKGHLCPERTSDWGYFLFGWYHVCNPIKHNPSPSAQNDFWLRCMFLDFWCCLFANVTISVVEHLGEVRVWARESDEN